MAFHWTCRLAALAALSCLAAGCGKDNALTASLDRSYRDPIQGHVVEKLDAQSQHRTGRQRWESYQQDDYQSDGDLPQDPVRRRFELRRREAARQLLSAGPLNVVDCLANSLEFNDRIQASREVIRSTGGDKLIANSRFLPRLAFDLSASSGQNVASTVSTGGRAFMSLLEFGKDNPIDVSLRQVQRQALFNYEDLVAAILQQVRVRFYTVLLKERQLAQRRMLREEFVKRYDRMKRLEEARRVVDFDVLTARLNVLNEDARINTLEKEIVRQKMDLLYAVGFPVETTDFTLAGEAEDFCMPLEESLATAYQRSTSIAQGRATVFEQDRVVRQIIWDYLPHVDTQVQYRSSFGAAGTALTSTDDNLYSMRPFAERPIRQWNYGTFADDPFRLSGAPQGWQWAMDLDWPIFTGLERTGRFERENAFLQQDRHLLDDTVAQTRLRVVKAYQTVLEQARLTAIDQEVVSISMERLRATERLKELGKVSDNDLETFRDRYFADQDRYFEQQIQLIEAQERLRLEMRCFEPTPPPKDEQPDEQPYE